MRVPLLCLAMPEVVTVMECRICARAGPVVVEEFGVPEREPAPLLEQSHVVDEDVIAVDWLGVPGAGQCRSGSASAYRQVPRRVDQPAGIQGSCRSPA